MNSILLNFSGHPLSEEAKLAFGKSYMSIYTAPPFEFDFQSEPTPQLSKAIEMVPFALDGSVSVTVIPPGQATLAVLLFSFLHGMLGHFPRLCYLGMAHSGVYVPDAEYEVTLQGVRMAGRAHRSVRDGKPPTTGA